MAVKATPGKCSTVQEDSYGPILIMLKQGKGRVIAIAHKFCMVGQGTSYVLRLLSHSFLYSPASGHIFSPLLRNVRYTYM